MSLSASISFSFSSLTCRSCLVSSLVLANTTVPGHTNLLRLPGPRSAEMRRELDKLRSLHMQESYGSDLLAVCSLVELMVAINQSAADRSMQSALSADMASDRVVDGVLSYINEHYNEALTLDALAERFFISKYHLLRKFEAQVLRIASRNRSWHSRTLSIGTSCINPCTPQ